MANKIALLIMALNLIPMAFAGDDFAKNSDERASVRSNISRILGRRAAAARAHEVALAKQKFMQAQIEGLENSSVQLEQLRKQGGECKAGSVDQIKACIVVLNHMIDRLSNFAQDVGTLKLEGWAPPAAAVQLSATIAKIADRRDQWIARKMVAEGGGIDARFEESESRARGHICAGNLFGQRRPRPANITRARAAVSQRKVRRRLRDSAAAKIPGRRPIGANHRARDGLRRGRFCGRRKGIECAALIFSGGTRSTS